MSKGKVNFWWYLLFFVFAYLFYMFVFGAASLFMDKVYTIKTFYVDTLMSIAGAIISTIGFHLKIKIAQKRNAA